MRFLTLFLAFALLSLTASGQIVINEVVYDDSGLDDREFVELYNAGGSPVDISGWLLEAVDEAFPADNNADYTVPAATPMIPAGGFYVFGAGTVANVNQVVGVSDLWENSNETILLRDSGGNIQDSVTYEGNKINPMTYPMNFVEGTAIWGNFASIDITSQSWARWADGADSNNNGADFGLLPLTPGASNASQSNLFPMTETFDGLAINTDAPNWVGSFVNPIVDDPTAPATVTSISLPASPFGGSPNLAMFVFDSSGGGDTAMFNHIPSQDFALECHVFIDTSLAACPDYATWTIGVRGTTATFHNHPNPDPTNGPCGSTTFGSANGNTGICWSYINENGGGTLRLLDENDGGPDETILASIRIVAGVNDGWQRLRLVVAGDVVDANFGGILGLADSGERTVTLTQTIQTGQVYMGYREFIAVNANIVPLIVDNLSLDVGTPTYSLHMSQPVANSLQVDWRGLTAGNSVVTLFSLIPCATGAPPVPVLGLCSFNPIADFGFQLTATGLPFSQVATSGSATFGPLPGIPPGLVVEAACFSLVGGSFANVSPIGQLITQ